MGSYVDTMFLFLSPAMIDPFPRGRTRFPMVDEGIKHDETTFKRNRRWDPIWETLTKNDGKIHHVLAG